MMRQLRDFLLRGNVVDLAVAVVVGAAFGAVVSALVADLLTPLSALLERRKAGAEPEVEAALEDVVLLGEIRDLLRANRA
jgi:large conductance mechanosensitive channel